MSDITVEKAVFPVLSALDSEDVLNSSKWDVSEYEESSKSRNPAGDCTGIDDDTLSVLFNAIPRDYENPHVYDREKVGYYIITSDNGYEYEFVARYLITLDRIFTSETIHVERRAPNGNSSGKIQLYHKISKATPVTGDAQTIAKRVISRLSEVEPEEDKWTFGVSFRAEAHALFDKIPRQRCEHEKHTSYERGEMTVLYDDGLEYTFVSRSSSDCGGSERHDKEALWILSDAIGLERCIYDHDEYSR